MANRTEHQRAPRRTGRRLQVLELEARSLLAPVLQIPPASESDGPLLQPPVINSVNGVLQANVDMIRADPPGGTSVLYGGKPTWSNPSILTPPLPPGPAPSFPLLYSAAYQFTTADGQVLPAQFPGPTLHIQPGDSVNLTIHNSLGDTPSQLSQDSLTTNIHFHGMEVSPLGNGDNIYRVMKPGGTYQTQIQVPSTETPGVDWYHPHHHMATADQVQAGLAGAIQVGDPLDPWPQYLGQFNERLLELSSNAILPTDPSHPDQTRVPFDPVPNIGGGTPLSPTTGSPYDTIFPTGPDGSPSFTWRKYINGEFMPTLTLRPGQTEIWTFVGSQRNGSFNFGITDANGQHPWSGTILAYDGNEANVLPRPITLSLPKNPTSTNAQGIADPLKPDGPMTVDPGARLTMAVTAPQTPGTYYLDDNYTLANLPYFDVRDGHYKAFALATIQVAGPPVTTPPPVFPQTGSIPDLYTAIPDQKRTFSFASDLSGPVATQTINGFTFADGPIVPLQVGQVEQWTLVNPSKNDHPFHLHQNDFAVLSINGQPVSTQPVGANNTQASQYTSLRDTVNIPAGGNVVIQFRVSPFLGKYVFHCHILSHEDAGMMTPVLVMPNASQRRVALGAGTGEGGKALVQDGHGSQVGSIDPLPRGWKGGVATATGDLNGDLVQDIVAGPASPGAPGFVTIYDGATLQPIKRFLPFPESPRSGVSLAIGDIDGTGNGDIVVSRVGPGPSLVRIFQPDGTLWRELDGVLPGRFPHGVTVASSDFNGDNYDDIAIGAGKGRDPLVVGIDGFSLGDPNGSQQVPIFSFVAPGGRGAGVNLAAGYFDPQTRPAFLANLITTPQSGRLAGTVSVWTVPLPESVMASMAMAMDSGDDSMSLDPSQDIMQPQVASPSSTAPQLMATLHPLGPMVHGGLHLAVTNLGTQGLDALAAWTSAHRPVYQSINDAGVVTTIRTPVP